MKGTASQKKAPKPSKQAEQASAALAVAEKAVKSAAEKSKQAKHQRKLAKKAVQAAKKELKQAKRRRAEARRALAATKRKKTPPTGAKKSVKTPASDKSVHESKKVQASPAKRKSKPTAKRRKPRTAPGRDADPAAATLWQAAPALQSVEETPPAPSEPMPLQPDIVEGKEIAPQTTTTA